MAGRVNRVSDFRNNVWHTFATLAIVGLAAICLFAYQGHSAEIRLLRENQTALRILSAKMVEHLKSIDDNIAKIEKRQNETTPEG